MARCASCSYPLTIIDSIVCYECSSYFHIDCAQLVGFPYYELSSDPSKNTFRCATCEILPLPRRRSDSDSDSESEDTARAMPSRQLDYQLEGEADLAKNLIEVQGSVQDLSDLCKDMLREINELKSINLTLRCCIENLRHDNEKRDGVIAELKYRLDALERNKTSNRINTEGSEWNDNREGDAERYLTPEPEIPRIEEISTSFSKAYDAIIPDHQRESVRKGDEIIQHILPEEKTDDGGDIEDDGTTKSSGDVKYSSEIKEAENYHPESETESLEKEILLYSEKSSTFDINQENKAEELTDTQQRRKDWDWKGSKAVEVEALEDEESEEEETESETSQVEEGGSHSWEILEEEIQSKSLSQPNKRNDESVEDFWSSKREDEYEEDEDTEKEEEGWKDKLEMRDTPKERISDKEQHNYEAAKEPITQTRTSKNETESSYDSEGEEGGDVSQDQESSVQEDTPEDGAEKKEIEGQLSGEGDEEKLLDGVEGEVTAEGVTVLEGEPRLDGDEEARLEGEGSPQPTIEVTTCLEGEQGVGGEQLGGQSPEEGEEVQPTEPQPSPLPEHTEEDLWLYLKETVTSVHPATVEEFVQNLIGTLQHVPEEYLKPVIDANIKRAVSPCITDGEQPATQEGVSVVEGQEAPPDGLVPVESSGTGEVPEVTSEVAGDAATSELSPGMPDSALPEEATEGFPVVEATA